MPHLTESIAARERPFHTFEVFPPKTQQGFINLLDRVKRLASAPLPEPLAVSVTWGAGGSTADRSLELAEQIVAMGIEVILHLTCTNMPREKVDEALEKSKQIGIHNILALRGDAPRSEEYALSPPSTPDFFHHADDLVSYIRENYGSAFCIGVAGYPTPHPDSPSAEADIRYLKQKCDAGADFIITQLFYDVDGFLEWVQTCRRAGITQPIIPGIMPIQNYASFRRLTNLCKCPIPVAILEDLEPIKSDDAAVKRYGAQLATTFVRKLLSSGSVSGVHFCTLNLEKSVRTVLDNLNWTSSTPIRLSPPHRHNQLIADDPDGFPEYAGANPLTVPIRPNGHAATDTIAALSISPSEASQLAQWGLSRNALPPAPRSGLAGAATPQLGAGGNNSAGEDAWDEYPNGRFTDVRSPAYGEIDGWGSGLKTTPAVALAEWGTPTNAQELSNLFTAYLNSAPETPTTPFCDLPLSPESQTILPHLLALNSASKQYWTVGSQPAVDAARSEDPIHGFGPRGGYVFQKAFVEFFVKPEVALEIERAVEARGQGQISFYAGNKSGEFKTNMAKDDVNAVTWAVFPGQEIVQSTIIEEVSFQAWKEEAFEIWSEWAVLYPRSSPSRRLLNSIADEWWLVSLIHHDYKDTGALWRFLLEQGSMAAVST